MEQIGSEYNFNTGGSIKALNDLIAKVEQLDKQVNKVATDTKTAGDSIAKLPTKTTKAASGFDALGNSINQVTREFPAFAFSAQTGFLAVSNNIPILIDSINALKVANAQLAAEGKATIPIFKQIISSLFSWQTALSLLVSFSVMYGKEIGNFIITMFNASNSMDTMAIRLDALNEAYKSKELKTNIESLIELRKNLDLAQEGYVNKQDVLKTYNEQFGKVLGTTNDVNVAEQNLIKATPELINAYISRAASAKLLSDASQTVIDIQQKRAEVEQEGLGQSAFLMNMLENQRKKGLITEEEYFKQSAQILENGTVKGQTLLKTSSTKELKELEDKYANQIKLALDFSKQSEDVLKGAGIIDDGSKEREAKKLKAIKDAEAKAKAILDKKVQDELKAVQEIYIKSVESKDATNKSKEDAEIKLLESQRDIFEKYKKYDEKYAQDSLDTREKLAEMKLSISEKENAERIKLLQEEYKSDDAFMQKTIDNELDAIDEKYVAIREGAILSSEEQKLLDLKQTQDKIQALEKVKDAGEKYSDELVKLKKKESLLITSINKETADEEIKIKQQVVAKLLDLGQVGVNELTKYRTDSNNYETEQEIANAQKLYDSKSITEDEFNRRKAQALNQQARTQREIDLSQIQINTALSIIKTFAQFGYPAGIPLAILAAAEGAVQYAFASAQPLPQFAKGTDMVSGGIRGKDSVHALLMPQEAVIPTKENLARPGLAKAWIDGNLDRHLMMNYIRPAIDENNRRWEASLKVNQNSTFIRNDNFSDKRIVNGLDRINRKLSNKEQRVVITKSKGRIWN
jgi:outer membrane murein-binding lipoprotein Lpp